MFGLWGFMSRPDQEQKKTRFMVEPPWDHRLNPPQLPASDYYVPSREFTRFN